MVMSTQLPVPPSSHDTEEAGVNVTEALCEQGDVTRAAQGVSLVGSLSHALQE